MNISRLTLLVCLAVLNICAAATAQTHRFDVVDLDKLSGISDPQLSPDGKSVVIVVSHPNNAQKRYDSELVLVDAISATKRLLTHDRLGVEKPRWSPAGNALAFLAKTSTARGVKQLFVMPMNGGDALQLTSLSNGVDSFAWSPLGKDIAYVTADEPTNKLALAQGDDAFEVGNDSFLTTAEPTSSHLWLVSADGGPARRLTSGAWSVALSEPGAPYVPFSWSPDGRLIAFTRQATPHSGDSDFIAVNLLDVATGAIHPLTQRTRNEDSPVFSPDGSKLVYWHWPDGINVCTTEVHVSSVTGGGDKIVGQSIDRNILTTRWMPDSQSLLVAAHDGTRVSAWLQPLEGSARKLNLGTLNLDSDSGSAISVGHDGAIAFVGSDSQHPQELYYLASPEAAPRQLTRFNEAATSALALGNVEAIKWKGPDGWNEDGVLIYPPNFEPGKKYPLVVRLHGGPANVSNEVFDKLGQYLAAQGYLVFRPNYRGSDNLGNAYQKAIVNDAGVGPGNDVMAGLQVVEQRGFVDTNRLAVCGWSYGGYMTVWLLSHYSCWQAGVAGAAMTDWVEDYCEADCNIQDRHAFTGGTPWSAAYAKAYVEQSPITYATNIHAPTLILCDVGDYRVPITQSYKLYHALHDCGVTTKFIAYPTSGHWPNDPVHNADIYRRWAGWLDQYLKPDGR